MKTRPSVKKSTIGSGAVQKGGAQPYANTRTDVHPKFNRHQHTGSKSERKG